MPYNLLQNKKGLIFGALNEDSIAWKVAVRARGEGASLILSNTPVSIRVGKTKELADLLDCMLVPADVTNLSDIEMLIEKCMLEFGGKIDFILHSVAMSPNVRKGRSYSDTDYADFLKTIDVSALSLHKVLQTSLKMDAISEGGSVVTLSYISSQRILEGYNDMSEAKAMLESVVRNFGSIYGRERKVRINAVLQSPVTTPATSIVKGMDKVIEFSNKMSPLGNASGEDCASLCVALFSDLTPKLTMQSIANDGGFSGMSLSNELIDMM